MLVVALATAASTAHAEPFDCNGFPDFRARMNCYDVTSRGPKRDDKADDKTATSSQTRATAAKRPGPPKRRTVQPNRLE
jgi:hypothetical protein